MSELSVVLAGGGTAGHVNPLLATADALCRRVPQVRITVLGTAEGLESRLVPERGYDLSIVPRVPFPRRPNRTVFTFPASLRRAIRTAGEAISQAQADVVVGFGGYVSTPAYLAARSAGLPIVIHEGNARPGLANRLGVRLGSPVTVATTFAATKLPGARVIGMPLRPQIRHLDPAAARDEGMAHFGLDPQRPTLLVFGGSLGAARLNHAFSQAAADVLAAGVQVLHLTGADKDVELPSGAQDTRAAAARYVALPYTDRMELAYAVADLAVCRAGAGTVCELSAIGIPAIYVPLPIGNGEQRLNAQEVVAAGGGLLVADDEVDDAWVRNSVLPLLQDRPRLAHMAASAAEHGIRDADDQLVDLVLQATA